MKSRTVTIIMNPTEETTPQLLAEKMSCLRDKVRTRAYELFERRGRSNGYDLDDWVQAANELGLLRSAEIKDTEAEIRLRIECPEVNGGQLKIYAEPQAITAEGVSRAKSEGPSRKTLTESAFFGRYDLPTMIHTESVKATLQKGVIEIVAKKAESAGDQPKHEAGEAMLKAMAVGQISAATDLSLDPRQAFIPGRQ